MAVESDPSASSPATEGKPLGQRYLLHESLGRGAMGQVFRATTRDSADEFAVKVLRSELADDPEILARFLQERTILTSVSSPHVVRVYDMVVDDGALAIVTELVRGPDLRRYLRERGTLPPSEAVDLVTGVLDGLAAVHAQGVVHRDVKPENVLVDLSGTAPTSKLTDFGISRLVSGPSLTRMTGLIGTPDYLAPELIDRQHATPAADVYSTGILLYELVVGVAPFAGGHPAAVVKAHLEQNPGRPDGIPDPLWDQISAMVDKDPTKRPPAHECSSRLAALLPQLDGHAALQALDAPPPAVDTMPDRLSAESAEQLTILRMAFDEQEQKRKRNLVLSLGALGALALALVLILTLVVLPGGNSQSLTERFGADVLGGKVGVDQTWSVSNGLLHVDDALTNLVHGTSTVTYDAVVPKQVARSSSDLEQISPSRFVVVKRDPVVKFTFKKVPAMGVRHVDYSAQIAGGVSNYSALNKLIADQETAQSAYDRAAGITTVTLQSLSVTPATVTLGIGQSAQLTIAGAMSNGSAAPSNVLAATWSSSPSSVVTVSSSGSVTGVSAGNATVTATIGSDTAQSQITVSPSGSTTTTTSGFVVPTTDNIPGTTVIVTPTTGSHGETTTTTHGVATTTTTAKVTTTTAKPTTTTTTTAKPTTTTTTLPPSPITAGINGNSAGGGFSASGTGNVNYAGSKGCTSQTAFSDGHYPPYDCSQEGGTASSENIYISGSSECVSASRPYSGSTFTWTATIPRTGSWAIQIYLPYYTNYNTGAVYDWNYAGGSSSTSFNQQAYAEKWQGITTQTFDAGQTYSVVLGTTDNSGNCQYTVADSVRWVWEG